MRETSRASVGGVPGIKIQFCPFGTFSGVRTVFGIWRLNANSCYDSLDVAQPGKCGSSGKSHA